MVSTCIFTIRKFPLRVCSMPRPFGRLSKLSLGCPQARYNSKKSSAASRALNTTKKATGPKPSKPSLPPAVHSKALSVKKSLPNKPPATEAAKESQQKYFTLDSALGEAEGPTLLYRRNTFKYNLVCYTISGISIWVGYSNYYTNIIQPQGLKQWVLVAEYLGIILSGVVSVATIAMPIRLIRTIHAIPYKPSLDARPTIKLLITRSNILPFLPPRKSLIPLHHIHLSRGLSPRSNTLQGSHSNFHKIIYSIATMPYRAFAAGKDFITRDRYVPVYVKSNRRAWNLHEDGWQWEKNGLERLIGTRPKW